MSASISLPVSITKFGDAAQAKHDVRFTNAYTLLGLLSNIWIVDKLLDGLKQDSIVLMTGSGIRLRAAESYCLRAQLPENRGGLDGASFFIDGGNSFDVYLFTSIARAHGLDYQDAMDKLVLSRAFTPYELKQLICKDSDEVFKARQTRLLVISDIFSLFEHDIEIDEAVRIMDKIARSIGRANEYEQIPIVITAASVPKHLEKFAEYACNTHAEFIEEEHRITAKLLRHPKKSPVELVAEVGTNYNQLLLSPLRATADG